MEDKGLMNLNEEKGIREWFEDDFKDKLWMAREVRRRIWDRVPSALAAYDQLIGDTDPKNNATRAKLAMWLMGMILEGGAKVGYSMVDEHKTVHNVREVPLITREELMEASRDAMLCEVRSKSTQPIVVDGEVTDEEG